MLELSNKLKGGMSLVLLVICSNAMAYEVTGNASYNYSEIGSYMLNSDIIRSNAKKRACENAYSKYISTYDSVKKSNYLRVQRQIEDNLDMYMTCSRVVDEENDSGNSVYNIVVKANVDTNKIDEVIMGSSKIATEGAESDIAILMIVRTATSVLKRDDKRVDVYRDTDSVTRTTSTDDRNSSASDSRSSESSQFNRQNEKTVDSDQLEAAGDTGASISSRTATGETGSYNADSQSMSDSQNENTSDTSRTDTTIKSGKKETGGSTLVRADKISYELSDEYQDAVEANLDEPLSDGGFELISISDFEPNLLDAYEEMRTTYVSSNKMNRKLERKIKKELEADGIDCFIEGSFDVGQPERDAATGQDVANVTVRKAKTNCFKAKKEGAKKRWRGVGTVGGIQAKGLGTTRDEAINNAIAKAAKKVGQQMLQKLNKKGIN